MDTFLITGQKSLTGTVSISGAKNAILPIMSAALLSNGKSTLTNVPDLEDLKNMGHLLNELGATVHTKNGTMVINAKEIISTNVYPFRTCSRTYNPNVWKLMSHK